MSIFEKKKNEEEFVPPVDVDEINVPPMRISQPFSMERDMDKIEDNSQALAPVFVKLSKYREILNTVNYLKMGFNLIKNQMSILSKLENLQRENMKLMYSALDKISKQMDKLDSDFSRPMDFMKEVSETELQELEGLESTISDLKAQIDQLKIEVDAMA